MIVCICRSIDQNKTKLILKIFGKKLFRTLLNVGAMVLLESKRKFVEIVYQSMLPALYSQKFILRTNILYVDTGTV